MAVGGQESIIPTSFMSVITIQIHLTQQQVFI